MTACAGCGAVITGAGEDRAPLTWTMSVEDGRVRWWCDACSREHLRSIEARLDLP